MFNKATHYALWGLVYTQMQNFNGIKPGIKEIAEKIKAPPLSVAKIFQRLVRLGFIISLKGKGGGFYFDKNIPELTIKELIHATMDDKIITDCFLGLVNCSPQNPCPVHGQWKTIRESIDWLVSTVTIQSLARSYSTFINSKELALSND